MAALGWGLMWRRSATSAFNTSALYQIQMATLRAISHEHMPHRYERQKTFTPALLTSIRMRKPNARGPASRRNHLNSVLEVPRTTITATFASRGVRPRRSSPTCCGGKCNRQSNEVKRYGEQATTTVGGDLAKQASKASFPTQRRSPRHRRTTASPPCVRPPPTSGAPVQRAAPRSSATAPA